MNRPGENRRGLRILRFALSLAGLAVMVALGSARGAGAPTTSQPRKITVVMANNFPPYVFKAPSGELQGILVESWKAWEKATGVTVEIHAVEWSQAGRLMKAGAYDVIDAVFETDTRKVYMDFTKPFGQIPVQIFFRADIQGIRGLDSLEGFAVGAENGSAAVELMKAHHVSTFQLFPTYEELVQAAKDGKVNVFILDAPPAIYFLNKLGIEAQFRRSEPVQVGLLRRGVAKGNTELLRLVDEGFDRVGPETLQAINDRWMGKTIPQAQIITTVVYVASGVGVALALLIAWNQVLRRSVNRRTAALKASEERWKFAVEGTGDGLSDWDVPKGIVSRTAQWKRLLGFAEGEIGTTPDEWQNRIHPEDLKGALAAVSATLEGKEPSFSIEYRLLCKDGTYRWFLTRGMVLTRTPGGKPLRLIASLSDVSVRKAAELRLVAESRKNEALLQTSMDGIYVLRLDGTVVEVNDSFCAHLGYSRSELMGMNVSRWDERWSSDRLKAVTAAGFRQGLLFETTHVRKDGGHADVEINATSLDVDGHRFLYASVRDITARRALEEELRQSQKLEAIGKLAGGVAHDFNNILTGVILNLDMVGSDPRLPLDLRSQFAETGATVRRAASITEQLLLFARRRSMSHEIVDLNAVLRQLLKMMRRLLGEQIDVVVTAGGEPLWVRGDPGMLDQLIMNIAINGRDAMPGGGTLTFETTTTRLDPVADAQNPEAREGAFAHLRIADTGSGIAEDILPRIFEPFFTTKEIGKGTGLGLSSAYGIVRQHKGWICVQSALGKGTAFDIYLPLEPLPQVPAPAASLPSPLPRGHERILLAEDEELVRKVLTSFLTKRGYQVQVAASGPEALDLWNRQRHEFDLLLTDAVMPGGIGGVELAGILRRQKPSLKIIIMSGYTEQIVDGTTADLKGLVFVRKPFESASFAETLRTCFQ